MSREGANAIGMINTMPNHELDVKIKPWDLPVKDYVKSFAMVVSIYDDEKLIYEQNVDYGNYEDRKLLGRITYWAVSKGYTVETSKA